MIYMCGGSDFHPYECSHDEHCIHCTNGVREWHNPKKCWACCDGDPKTNKPWKVVKRDYQHPIRVRDYSHRKLNIKVLLKQPQEELPF